MKTWNEIKAQEKVLLSMGYEKFAPGSWRKAIRGWLKTYPVHVDVDCTDYGKKPIPADRDCVIGESYKVYSWKSMTYELIHDFAGLVHYLDSHE